MNLKLILKESQKYLNNFFKNRKTCRVTSGKLTLVEDDFCLRTLSHVSSNNKSKQLSLSWGRSYFFSSQKQLKSNNQRKSEIERRISYWLEVNKGYLGRSILQADHKVFKNAENIKDYEHSSRIINRERPINTINSLILLLKHYNNSRCQFIAENSNNNEQQQKGPHPKVKPMNKLILQATTEILSTLHYIVSSVEFNLGAYERESNSDIQMEFPYIGTLINTLVEILSFNCQPKSQQFDQFMICVVELIDLYLTSFIHMTKSPLQHLYVDDACGRLAKMKANYSSQRINHLIQTKYSKRQKQSSQLALFHKSFQSIKSLPSYQSTKNQYEYNYKYSQIDESYYMFIKQQVKKIAIDSHARGHISMLEQQIDRLIEGRITKGDNKMNVIKNIELYIEWIRRFYLYEDVDSMTPQILLRLEYCISQVVEFIGYQRNNYEGQVNQLSSSLFNLNCEESLTYLIYFYLAIAQNLASSSIFIDQTNVQEFDFMIYGFVQRIFDAQYSLTQCQSQPKLACIQLQIFKNLNKLKEKVNKSKSIEILQAKFITAIIQSVMISYIEQEKYKNFPYLYLTWFYDRIIDIIQSSNIQNLSQYKSTILKCVISAITEKKLNKLSQLNRIHSIYLIIRHSFQLQKQIGQNSRVYHNKILNWLCLHNHEQLLTQDEDELCNIFEYFLPLKNVYCEFLSAVVSLSFGEFSWQGFNKLYYYSLIFYSFQQTEHKLTHSQIIQTPHYLNKRAIKQEQRMNMEYMRRYILNEYTAMGVRRREIPLSSYFYRILELQTPQTFYKNYFQNYGNHQ